MGEQEGRWRAGANRQSQASAQEHQRAAGLASGAKRKDNAMSEKESKARKAAHKVEVRARKKVEREAAAAAAVNERDVTLQQLNDLLEEAYLDEHPDDVDGWDPVGEYDWAVFRRWVAQQHDADKFELDCCTQFYDAWCEETRYAPPPPELPLPPTGHFSLPPLCAQPPSATAAAGPPPADPDDDDPHGEVARQICSMMGQVGPRHF